MHRGAWSVELINFYFY